jgi:hypothetical protein
MATRKSSIKARDGHGRAIRSLETLAQDQPAAELRSASVTYPQIAEQLGISVTTAYESVSRGMVAIPTEGQIEAKRLELAKLDRRQRYLFGVLAKASTTVEQGIAACNAFDRTQKRRAALLGFDEPARTRVEVITEDVVEAEIRRLEAQLGLEDRLGEVGLEP